MITPKVNRFYLRAHTTSSEIFLIDYITAKSANKAKFEVITVFHDLTDNNGPSSLSTFALNGSAANRIYREISMVELNSVFLPQYTKLLKLIEECSDN